MKFRIFALAAAVWCGGALHASNITSCGWSLTALNSCNSLSLPSFTSQLDWAAFGLNGSVHGAGLWTASLASGIDITISTTGIDPGEGARTAANYGSIYYKNKWYDYNNAPVSGPAAFIGHFDAPSTAYSYVYPNSPYAIPGDHLMGLAGDSLNGNTNKSLIIDLGVSSVSDLAFRIAAVNKTSFNATLTIFDGINGSGNVIRTTTLFNLMGGGNCASLRPGTNNVPVACNDANLIAATNLVNARSFQIQTNDASGFYIGDLYQAYNNELPEPTPLILAGGGLLVLAAAKKKFRKQ